MAKKKKLSVVLATYNEARNIRNCLVTVKDIADEMIVFDESSTDRTRPLARQMGAKVFKVKHEPIFHVTKQKAIDKAKGEWILQLDADERITPQLRREIEREIKKEDNEYSAYYIKRKNYFLDKWMMGSGMWPDSVIRLFKKGEARLPQKHVHEQMEVDGEIGTLNNPMEHFTAPTFSKYLTNANRYTTLTALELEKKKLPINFFTFLDYVFWKPTKTFLNLFFRHKGFIDGAYGFVFDLFSGLHHTIAYFKYWQLKNNPEIKEEMVDWR